MNGIIIKLVGLSVGGSTPFDGKYLSHYNPSEDWTDDEGRQMIARIETVSDPQKALLFPGMAEAHAEWTKVDERNPVRPDGKPNRPLTAFTAEFLPFADETIVKEG